MDIVNKIQELSKKHKEVVIYPDVILKNLYSGIGRVPGNFCKELLEFLKATNGASVLDYCFLGFKNRKLGVDLDKFVLELWSENDSLAGKVIGFMINSTGDTFGYLTGSAFSNLSFETPIVYNSAQNPNELHVLSTSFNRFMNTFLNDIEYTIQNSSDDLRLEVEIEDWPVEIQHWAKNDSDLAKLYDEIGITEEGIIKLI